MRPLDPLDFDELYLAAKDSEIWNQLPPRAQNRYKQTDFSKFFEDLIQTHAAFCILDIQTQLPIGTTKYYVHCDRLYMGGTFLKKDYWGGKYNYAFRSLLIEYAFQYYDEIHIHITENNVRNRRATEKLGFHQSFSEVFDNGYTYITYKCTRNQWQNKYST